MPSLVANMLSIYQMTHIGSPKRVAFEFDMVEITKSSTGNLIEKGFDNHASKAYEFSHFLPASHPRALLTHANNTSKLCHEKFGHLNFKYIQQLHNDKMVEGFPLIKTSDGVCLGCLVGKHSKKRYEVGKATRAASTLDMIHIDVSGPMPTTSIKGIRNFQSL